MWAATGRFGGVSRAPWDTFNLASHVGDDPESVAANRIKVATDLGLAAGSLAVLGAVHGASVAFADKAGTYAGYDALVTRTPGLALMALGADCVPIGLIGSDAVTIAAVHCGWRGLAADVVGAAIAAMRDLGTQVQAAILGPAVCGACYPVPPDRVALVSAAVSERVSSASITVVADGQPGVDVREGVRARLDELGVLPEAVITIGSCTVEDPGLFSYRRDGQTGRQCVAICTVPGEQA